MFVFLHFMGFRVRLSYKWKKVENLNWLIFTEWFVCGNVLTLQKFFHITYNIKVIFCLISQKYIVVLMSSNWSLDTFLQKILIPQILIRGYFRNLCRSCHMSCVTYHMSCVTFQMTCVTCHVSHVMCHMSHFFFFFFWDKAVELIAWGSVITRAYPV